ncbi:hypothetical protein CO172_02755 [Candidatus Uhrbacteria bacterium CG_4_9_14_3_um_filter_36_7]|uniref:Uncharacterized protein n=1 Tax=Candidatus Uhrbacteria bacterium CG_4_9_14_3_um_filter_36_7 TaxID=1975033 RepID=A0A2M7XH50_9BACT|nr:MAG: hypothetical protein CO172_02755 [Candidatus Uhrbacteria bacterium CG_4_9_14_3_um_filter_36_7]
MKRPIFLVLVLFLSACVTVRTNPLTGEAEIGGLTTPRGASIVLRAKTHQEAVRDNNRLAQQASRRGDPVSLNETTGSSSVSTGVQYPGYSYDYGLVPGSETAASASILADLMNLPAQIQEVDRRARRAEEIGTQNAVELDAIGETVFPEEPSGSR